MAPRTAVGDSWLTQQVDQVQTTTRIAAMGLLALGVVFLIKELDR